MALFESLPQELVDMIIDAAANSYLNDKKERQKHLRNISLVCQAMTRQARRRLLETVTFEGNSGFNAWPWALEVVQPEGRSEVQPARCPPVGPAAFVKVIEYSQHYDQGKVLPKDHGFLDTFINVERLKMTNSHLCPFENGVPKFGAFLGERIKILTLKGCRMDVNQFVGYLRLFKNLKNLEILDSYIEPEAFQSTPGTLPEFKGLLRLGTSEIGASEPPLVINMFNRIPVTVMKYSHIILGGGGGVQDQGALERFLSKSQATLKYLKIHSSWGPVDVTGLALNTLERVVIDSSYSNLTTLCDMVGLLPLNKIDLLLVIHPRNFAPRKYLIEWGNLDRKLTSHSHRGPHDGKLRFYLTGNYYSKHRGHDDDDKKWRKFLPTLMERPDVEVDRDLLNDPHRYYLSIFDDDLF